MARQKLLSVLSAVGLIEAPIPPMISTMISKTIQPSETLNLPISGLGELLDVNVCIVCHQHSRSSALYIRISVIFYSFWRDTGMPLYNPRHRVPISLSGIILSSPVVSSFSPSLNRHSYSHQLRSALLLLTFTRKPLGR